MPAKDGTGPVGQGMGNGRGLGRGGKGRMGGTRAGVGPAGNCVCPACGATVVHQRGTPCKDISCPQCGAKMTRQ